MACAKPSASAYAAATGGWWLTWPQREHASHALPHPRQPTRARQAAPPPLADSGSQRRKEGADGAVRSALGRGAGAGAGRGPVRGRASPHLLGEVVEAELLVD
eukprot:scaffold682_cov355-Prasinococcus_capsulatus_cf.AAC.1